MGVIHTDGFIDGLYTLVTKVPPSILEDCISASVDALACAGFSAAGTETANDISQWLASLGRGVPNDAGYLCARIVKDDFDSYNPGTSGHPIAMILPALIAGRHHARAPVMPIMATALEFMTRLGRMYGPGLRAAGHHPSTILGGAAAVIAAAMAKELPPTSIRLALLLYFSSVSGRYTNLSGPQRIFQTSNAVRTASFAVNYAEEAGRTSMRYEWWETLDSAVPMEQRLPYGQPEIEWWTSLSPTQIKPFPACAYFTDTLRQTHTFLESIDAFRHQRDIEEIYLEVPRHVFKAHMSDMPTAQNEIPFSLSYNVALLLQHGDPIWSPRSAQLTETTLATASKVKVACDETSLEVPVQETKGMLTVRTSGSVCHGEITYRRATTRPDPDLVRRKLELACRENAVDQSVADKFIDEWMASLDAPKEA